MLIRAPFPEGQPPARTGGNQTPQPIAPREAVRATRDKPGRNKGTHTAQAQRGGFAPVHLTLPERASPEAAGTEPLAGSRLAGSSGPSPGTHRRPPAGRALWDRGPGQTAPRNAVGAEAERPAGRHSHPQPGCQLPPGTAGPAPPTGWLALEDPALGLQARSRCSSRVCAPRRRHFMGHTTLSYQLCTWVCPFPVRSWALWAGGSLACPVPPEPRVRLESRAPGRAGQAQSQLLLPTGRQQHATREQVCPVESRWHCWQRLHRASHQ